MWASKEGLIQNRICGMFMISHSPNADKQNTEKIWSVHKP